MGLYLCVFEADDIDNELEGVEVGGYDDFGRLRETVSDRLEEGKWGSRWSNDYGNRVEHFALTAEERAKFIAKVVEDRYEGASTLIASQLPVKAWHEAIGEPTLADALCDRLVHCAHKIELRGPSMRQVRAAGAKRKTRKTS